MLAGILAAAPLTGKALAEHTIMIAGDGAAGTALAELLAEAIARQNMRCVQEAACAHRVHSSRKAACTGAIARRHLL